MSDTRALRNVLVLGGGKIGRTIASFLGQTGDYQVTLADRDEQALKHAERLQQHANAKNGAVTYKKCDASKRSSLAAAMDRQQAVVSALSYNLNPLVAECAADAGAHYFDLTEDVETTRKVRNVAANAKKGQVFIPQCGLAPGFISIVAHHLTKDFDELDRVRMRVGALPQFPSNALKYNLTWSTDGLINEYCNPCEAIHDGELRTVLPLEGLELFSLDGVRYEAFNTSGGLGSLCETLKGKVRELNYKTIRYTGHRELAALLVNDLRLSEYRQELKTILERAVPVTFQDVVVVFSTVSGYKDGRFLQVSDARKIYHQDIGTQHWSAIQLTTASGLCAIVDMVADGALAGTGFVKQESVSLDAFLANRFGRYYNSTVSSTFTLESANES